MAGEDALGYVFSLVFQLCVDGMGEGLAFLYFGGGALRSLKFELLQPRLHHQTHLFLTLLAHLLHLLHEGNVVIAVLLEQQHFDNIDEMFEHLVYNMLERQF